MMEPSSMHGDGESLRRSALHAIDLDGCQPGLSIVDYRQPWHNSRSVAYTRLRESLTKKWEGDNVQPTLAARNAATEKFLHSNTLCARGLLPAESWLDERLLGELREVLYEFWFPRRGLGSICDHWDTILENSRCGPGAAGGARGTDFYTKFFSSPLRAPSRAVARMYYSQIERHPLWVAAERHRIARWGHGVSIDGSRLTFAHKNATVARCICTEPSLGIYAQLGFGEVLEQRLWSFFGISLDDQPVKNRELARLGSICDGFATIDLESASDSMSLHMLRSLLPRPFYNWLCNLRSEHTTIGNEQVKLEMVSSMGNGFTFPLQTSFFSAIVAACFRSFDRSWPWAGVGDQDNGWGVFGDDIIVPKLLVPRVLRLLHLTGFRVNTAKSFVEGPFRESCGSDYYRGQNVRGVYLKALHSEPTRSSAVNQLNLFSSRTGVLVPHLVQCLG